MSRSYLHDKFMKEMYSRKNERNTHKRDEMPKNKPSKEILKYVDQDLVRYCEDTPSFSAHSRPTGGRRKVNGIVRANKKEETRKIIEQEINEKGEN